MTKRTRIFFLIFVPVVAFIIIVFFVCNNVLENRVESFLNTGLPSNYTESHQDLSVDVLAGNLSLEHAVFQIKNKETAGIQTSIKIEELSLTDFSYWDFLFNNKIQIEKIHLKNPAFTHFRNRFPASADSTKPNKWQTPLIIEKIEIENGLFQIFDNTQDSTVIYAENLNAEITSVRTDKYTVTKKIPFKFGEYSAKADSVFVKVSPYENLMVSGFELKNKNASFYDLKLKTKYSKSELSQIIKKERDHFDISVDSLTTKNSGFRFLNGRLFIDIEELSLHRPNVAIYRDKLVADDPEIKELYSKKLWELPFQLSVDSVKINEAFIRYSEKVKAENPAGTIVFSNLNAEIHNASNTYVAPKKTEIDIDAIFMEQTPIRVQWDFNVQNLADQFVFKAEIGALNAAKMNQFTEPNLNVRLEGEVKKSYFTIHGNNQNSNVDLKINYKEFKVTILEKDGREKNKLLTALVNLFIIKKESKEKADNYREGTAEVTRDKTKSVFNFLWLNVRDGLLSALTGGKK